MTSGEAVNLTAAVLGAGGAGQGMAAYLARLGYRVRLWNRGLPAEIEAWIDPVADRGGIAMTGLLDGFVPVDLASSDLGLSVADADVVFITTTADAHGEVGEALAPFISAKQVVVVMACKTGGAWEIRQSLRSARSTEMPVVAETPTTIVNSRVSGRGVVEIIGIKRSISLASLPADEVNAVIDRLQGMPLISASNTLVTSLNNFSIALHIVPMVTNAGRIGPEAPGFRFYVDGITESVAKVMASADEERMAIGKEFGIELQALSTYLTESLNAPAGSLEESVRGCEMYQTVPSPPMLDHKYLTEEVLAGLVPMIELADLAGVEVPVLRALLQLSSTLLGRDLQEDGRDLERMGLGGLDRDSVLSFA